VESGSRVARERGVAWRSRRDEGREGGSTGVAPIRGRPGERAGGAAATACGGAGVGGAGGREGAEGSRDRIRSGRAGLVRPAVRMPGSYHYCNYFLNPSWYVLSKKNQLLDI